MPAKRVPKYGIHKASGQARVYINGDEHYLGKYGSPESHIEYQRRIAEWAASPVTLDSSTLSIDALSLAYLEFAKGYYRKDGEPTTHILAVRCALRYPIRLYGPELASAFGPKKLKAVREAMVADDLSRKQINRLVDIIKRAFKWAASEELVAGSVAVNLSTVEALHLGRTTAREIPDILPVDNAIVDATLPHLLPQLVAMIELQRLTGARPGEITRLRPCDIAVREDGVWVYRPASHKNQHRGKDRTVFIGPLGQELLRPWLERSADSYCFSPLEAREEKFRRQRAARKTKVQPPESAGNRRTSPPVKSFVKSVGGGSASPTRQKSTSSRTSAAMHCKLSFGPRMW